MSLLIQGTQGLSTEIPESWKQTYSGRENLGNTLGVRDCLLRHLGMLSI